MFVERVTAPNIDTPITVAMVKEHLRVDYADEDDYIRNITDAAIEAIEDETGRCLFTQSWREVHDAPKGTIEVAKPDAIALTAIEQWNTSSFTWTALDVADFYLENSELRPRGAAWPSGRVRFTYTSGFGADVDDVPYSLRQAVLLVVAEIYENRTGTVDSRVTNALFGVDYLISRYRRFF